MGITIKNKNTELECGYIGFKILRDFIVERQPHEGLKERNKYFFDHLFTLMHNKSEMEKFNKTINDMDYIANKESTKDERKLLDYFCNFVWACDANAKMTEQNAVAIWHYIQNIEEDIRFGYSGRKNPATFQQFKSLIKECVETKSGFEWF